jgi:hypothetical protein
LCSPSLYGVASAKRFSQIPPWVLSLAKWPALKASKILSDLIVKRFATGDQPLVFGIDETIERRRGGKIKAKGIYPRPGSFFSLPLC